MSDYKVASSNQIFSSLDCTKEKRKIKKKLNENILNNNYSDI